MFHTMEDDFQHFLSCSGLRLSRPEIIPELRQAYCGAWQPSVRTCCFIPDQTRLDLGCKNLATYEIWFGNQLGPDDFSDTCNEHLEQMLDDNAEFKIFRIPVLEQHPSTCPYCGGKDYHHTTECYLGLIEKA